jgi:hypothetical protein
LDCGCFKEGTRLAEVGRFPFGGIVPLGMSPAARPFVLVGLLVRSWLVEVFNVSRRMHHMRSRI